MSMRDGNPKIGKIHYDGMDREYATLEKIRGDSGPKDSGGEEITEERRQEIIIKYGLQRDIAILQDRLAEERTKK